MFENNWQLFCVWAAFIYREKNPINKQKTRYFVWIPKSQSVGFNSFYSTSIVIQSSTHNDLKSLKAWNMLHKMWSTITSIIELQFAKSLQKTYMCIMHTQTYTVNVENMQFWLVSSKRIYVECEQNLLMETLNEWVMHKKNSEKKEKRFITYNSHSEGGWKSTPCIKVITDDNLTQLWWRKWSQC